MSTTTSYTLLLIAFAALSTTKLHGQEAAILEKQIDIAKTQRLRGNYAAAEQILKRVLAEQPDHFRATYNLGLAYSQAGRQEEAIATLSKAATLREKSDVQDFSIYSTLGWLQMQAGDYREAEKTFLIGVENKDALKPLSRGLLLNNLGALYLSQGQTAKAEPLFSEAAKNGNNLARTNLEVTRALEDESMSWVSGRAVGPNVGGAGTEKKRIE
jgi:Flp pilus assembly protein TadD